MAIASENPIAGLETLTDEGQRGDLGSGNGDTNCQRGWRVFMYLPAAVKDTTARREAEFARQSSELQLADACRSNNIGSWDRYLATDEEIWSAHQCQIMATTSKHSR